MLLNDQITAVIRLVAGSNVDTSPLFENKKPIQNFEKMIKFIGEHKILKIHLHLLKVN